MMFYKETNFKETPIGKVPKDWEVVRLTEVCMKIKAGGTPLTSKKEYYGGNIPFVKIEDLTASHKYLRSTSITITEVGLRNSSAWLVPPKSLLVAMYGSIGAMAINEIEVATNQAILAMIPKEKKTSVEFLFYLLTYLKPYLERYAKQTTQANLTAEIIKNFKAPFPNYFEQQKIAEILSTVDKAIQKTNEVIAKTERLKKGLMQELLTKGIGHKEFKDTEIGRIPKEWEVVRLEDITEIHDSKRIPLSEKERSNRKGPYPYCGANGIIDYIDDYIFDGEFVLLAEDGGAYGKFENTAYIMSGKFWVNNHAHILQAIKGKSSNQFILYALNFLDLNPYVVGTTRKKLNQEQMRAIKIPLPSLPEQQKIAEILLTVDKKLELERNEKARLERIKQGLMDLLLTGKIRVKVD
ncbi:MAG: restriction endonuclease subunit S [Thermoproteota archaeon]